MDQKYQKEESKILERTVWFIETPGISYKGGVFSDRYNINTILKMRGTKKNSFYLRIIYILQTIFYKLGMKSEPFETYLKTIGNKKISDSKIYENMKTIYQKNNTSASNSFNRGDSRADKIKILLDKSGASSIITYLDYGCGSGELTRAIGSHLNLKSENIQGVDIVHYSKAKGLNFIQIKSDGKIPHPDNHFDLITASMVFHHLRDEKLSIAISEIYRVLKIGGTFIIREHNVHTDEHNEMTILLDFMHEVYDDVLSSDTAWHDTGEYYASYKSLENWDILIQSHGFTLNQYQPYFNSDVKFNPISQYMRIYNKSKDGESSVSASSASASSASASSASASSASASSASASSALPVLTRILDEKIPRKPKIKNLGSIGKVKESFQVDPRTIILAEIEFLTIFYKSDTYKKNPEKQVYAIYSGTNIITHIEYLLTLFPEVFFIMYGSHNFAPILSKNNLSKKHIQTHEQLFSDEIAEEWQSVDHQDKHILFVSDIGTNNKIKQWWQIMEPTMAMFKFQLTGDLKTTEYPEGDIYLQLFSSPNSMETRLIIRDPNASTKVYDNNEYEERMFQFNSVERFREYANILYKTPLEERAGSNNQYDSAGEIHILENYILMMSPNISNKDIISKIIEMIKTEIIKPEITKIDKPIKKTNIDIIRKLKAIGEIPKNAPLTEKVYNKYIVSRRDDLINRGILDPNYDIDK